jgi:hypothetical protein
MNFLIPTRIEVIDRRPTVVQQKLIDEFLDTHSDIESVQMDVYEGTVHLYHKDNPSDVYEIPDGYALEDDWFQLVAALFPNRRNYQNAT